MYICIKIQYIYMYMCMYMCMNIYIYINTALAAHYGVKHDSDDPAVKDVCKEMDKKKE